jgi:predicted peptidase
LNRVVTVGGVAYNYQVFVPRQWDKKQKWPVILFLHGHGESGQDGLLQTGEGIGNAIRLGVERFPFLVVFPQCRKGDWWTTDAMEQQALQALAQTMKEFKGDPERIYLTGLSMGGFGTWDMGAKYASRFAALVPICGGVRLGHHVAGAPDVPDSPDLYTTAAQKIGKTPVWAFHGGADHTVPVTESRQLVEALKVAGGNVRYTEYPGEGHNSWDKAYAEPELLPWLLSQKLPATK